MVQSIQSYERIAVFIPYRMYTRVPAKKKNMANIFLAASRIDFGRKIFIEQKKGPNDPNHYKSA